MSKEDFIGYFVNKHAPIAKKLPGLRKYVINTAVIRVDKEPIYDGVSELWFNDLQSYRSAFSSPEGKTTTEDAGKLVSQTTTLIVEERTII